MFFLPSVLNIRILNIYVLLWMQHMRQFPYTVWTTLAELLKICFVIIIQQGWLFLGHNFFVYNSSANVVHTV